MLDKYILSLSDINDDSKIHIEEHNNEDKIRFITEGQQRMIISNSTTSGNIGIGLNFNNPTSTLDIQGDLAVSNKIGIGTSTVETSLDINSSLKVFDVLNDVSAYVNTSSGDYMKIQATSRTDTNTKKNIILNPDGGNVGIGTNPDIKFEIMSTATNGSTQLRGDLIELGKKRTSDGPSFIDFQTQSGAVDFNARIHRNLGENGNLLIQNLGTGLIEFSGITRFSQKMNLGSGYDGVNYGAVQIAQPPNGDSHLSFVRSGNYVVVHGFQPNTNNYYIAGWNSSGSGVVLAPGAQNWTQYSDERLKNVIYEYSDVLNKIKNIRCVNYRYITDDTPDKYGNIFDKNRIGMIAQDVQKEFPEVIDIMDDKGHLGIRTGDLIPITVSAIKELDLKVIDLKTELESEKIKVSTLESKNTELETKYNNLLERVSALESN